MAGYGVKEARINKGQRHAEENACGDCGTPIAKHEVLCEDCKQNVVVMSPNGSYRSYQMPHSTR